MLFRSEKSMKADMMPKALVFVPSSTTAKETNPRGASLYILRPGDIPEGCDKANWYTNGICIY